MDSSSVKKVSIRCYEQATAIISWFRLWIAAGVHSYKRPFKGGGSIRFANDMGKDSGFM